MKNPFSLKGKTTRQTLNQFCYYQLNYNISSVCLTAKEKSLFFLFFFCSYRHSLCVSRLKKKKSYFSITHTNYLSRMQQHFALFSSSLYFPHRFPWLSSRKRQHFTLSSLPIFLTAATLYSLLLDYLFLAFLPSENLLFLSWIHALFSLSP